MRKRTKKGLPRTGIGFSRSQIPAIPIAVCSLFLIASCERDRQPDSTDAPAIVLDGPIEFTVIQRSIANLPGASGRIVLSTGDISAGRVDATLAWRDGDAIAADRAMRTGDVLEFMVEGRRYRLKLTRLTNTLLGDDTAAFELSEAPAAETAATVPAMTEDAKIQALIDRLSRLEGATFLRNGNVHTTGDAVEHMQHKWAWKKDEIKTARDFIDKIASTSSTTGEPYRIRHADGREQPAADWFREQLDDLEDAK